MQHNTDITKNLKLGSLVAVIHPKWVGSVPQIATVTRIPDDLAETPEVEILWFEHNGGTKKATWLRIFRQSKRIQQFTLTMYYYTTLNLI